MYHKNINLKDKIKNFFLLRYQVANNAGKYVRYNMIRENEYKKNLSDTNSLFNFDNVVLFGPSEFIEGLADNTLTGKYFFQPHSEQLCSTSQNLYKLFSTQRFSPNNERLFSYSILNFTKFLFSQKKLLQLLFALLYLDHGFLVTPKMIKLLPVKFKKDIEDIMIGYAIRTEQINYLKKYSLADIRHSLNAYPKNKVLNLINPFKDHTELKNFLKKYHKNDSDRSEHDPFYNLSLWEIHRRIHFFQHGINFIECAFFELQNLQIFSPEEFEKELSEELLNQKIITSELLVKINHLNIREKIKLYYSLWQEQAGPESNKPSLIH